KEAVNQLLPEIIQYLHLPQAAEYTLDDLRMASDSGWVDLDTVPGLHEQINRLSKTMVDSSAHWKKTQNTAYYCIDNLLLIFSYLDKKQEYADFIQQLIPAEEETDYYIWLALKVQHKKGYPLSERFVRSLASRKLFRREVYDLLKDTKEARLFPKEYLTQEAFAEADFVDYCSYYYDEVPEQVKLLLTRPHTIDGKTGIIYLYTCKWYEDSKETYLGVSGLYPKKKKLLDRMLDFRHISYDEYDSSMSERDLEKLLEKWEKE
ncbi:MAG: hypothetical protein AAF206_24930, partial [Bacteroidota bacterium]